MQRKVWMMTILWFCLTGSAGYAQGEISIKDIGIGQEPSLATDRNGNLAVLWIDSSGNDPVLYRRTSSDRGSTWVPADQITEWSSFANEPTIAANLTTGDLYYGFLRQDVSSARLSMAYGDDLTVVDAQVSTLDRPWLIAQNPRAYAVWFDKWQLGDPHRIYFKKSDEITADPITWSASRVLVASREFPVSHFVYWPAIAKGRNTAADENFVYVMGVSYRAVSPYDATLKVFRSADGGDTGTWDNGSNGGWAGGTLLSDYPSPGNDEFGFYHNATVAMLASHILADPDGSAVYSFFTEMKHRTDGELVTKLYCRRSLNDGQSWDSAVPIVPDTRYDTFPSRGSGENEGYGDVPDNQGNPMTGFFRMGRIWSCFDDAGRLHVVWMDNRNGRSDYYTDISGNRWYRDQWKVYRAQCSAPTAQQMTWTTSVYEVSLGMSIGGFGLPKKAASRGKPYLPPGDTIASDADGQYLYVTWPDTSNYDPNDPTTEEGRVKFRRIPLVQ